MYKMFSTDEGWKKIEGKAELTELLWSPPDGMFGTTSETHEFTLSQMANAVLEKFKLNAPTGRYSFATIATQKLPPAAQPAGEGTPAFLTILGKWYTSDTSVLETMLGIDDGQPPGAATMADAPEQVAGWNWQSPETIAATLAAKAVVGHLYIGPDGISLEYLATCGDDMQTTQAALALWKELMGEQACAIALEKPHPQPPNTKDAR